VFRSAGFKAGAWHDVGWWQRPLADPPADPAPPRR
jgi:phosphinothricin acetyltransferase